MNLQVSPSCRVRVCVIRVSCYLGYIKYIIQLSVHDTYVIQLMWAWYVLHIISGRDTYTKQLRGGIKRASHSFLGMTHAGNSF